MKGFIPIDVKSVSIFVQEREKPVLSSLLSFRIVHIFQTPEIILTSPKHENVILITFNIFRSLSHSATQCFLVHNI